MRAAFNAKIEIAMDNVGDLVSHGLVNQAEARYLMFRMPQPIQQDGHEFGFVVAPFALTATAKLTSKGPGVVCETEAEGKDTLNNLTERSKKHLAIIQALGFGNLGWVSNYRRIQNEIAVLRKIEPDGQERWFSFEKETDKDTLEQKVLRSQESATQKEAKAISQQWLDEYNQQKEAVQNPVNQLVAAGLQVQGKPLTKFELADLAEAKMLVLQRQWPTCFKLFEKLKANPTWPISDQEVQDAYLVDLVEHGHDLAAATGGHVRADRDLISALHKAMERYGRRQKRRMVDTALYLIAFNWDCGWCYLSDQQIASELQEILIVRFTPDRAKKLRYRTLGLVAKHVPGPQPNLL